MNFCKIFDSESSAGLEVAMNVWFLNNPGVVVTGNSVTTKRSGLMGHEFLHCVVTYTYNKEAGTT